MNWGICVLTVKEYLWQIRRMDIAIQLLRRELDELRNGMDAIGGIDYAHDRVQTSAQGDAPYVRSIEHILEVEKELESKIKMQYRTRSQIVSQICSLKNPIYADILYRRYIQYKKYKNLESIADDMGYSVDHMRHLHGCALREFERIYREKITQIIST